MKTGDLLADRFEVRRLAASGGMGAVYACVDRETGGPVAVKLMAGSAARDRFLLEARVLAEIEHPSIVRYVAHGEAGGLDLFLAMEWLEGEDLRARAARLRLTIDESVALAIAVAEALAFAHARGVLHRDIKPGNVFLVDRDPGRAKILDFGIARARIEQTALTQTGQAIGSPGYMAPEQAEGGRDLDERADVFSLGCVLYECLTGAPPFGGDHVYAIIGKLLAYDPPPARDVAPGVPEALSDLVESMLAKDRGKRPASAAMVADALKRLGPISEAPPAPRAIREDVTLTAREQRFVGVVLARGRDVAGAVRAVSPFDPTLPSAELTARNRLAAALLPFGARAQWSGDGALVATVTGAPTPRDLAAQAARSGLTVRAAQPTAAIAVATGRGGTGSGLPTGAAIDRAARLLEEAAALDEPAVVLDEVTAGLLDARFQVAIAPSGTKILRGERDAIEPGRTLLGRATPHVGRDRELGALRSILDEAFDEPAARAALITAPAGAGKSRLVHELLTEMRGRRADLRTMFGRGDPMSAGSPFTIVARAVRAWMDLHAGEPIEQARNKIRDRVHQRAVADEAHVAELLGELVGVPFDAAESVRLRSVREDKLVLGEQMRRALEAWIAAECRGGPVLLILEDLHWGDAASVRAIDSLLGAVADSPLVVLATARPEVHRTFPELWSARGLSEIRLGELSPRAGRALVREMLGERAGAATVDVIVDRAGGNPLYLEELIRAEAEGRGDEPPETILAMMQARLEALPPGARQVLRAASIFGETFWRSAVIELSGGDARLDDTLAFLVERETIVRRVAGRFAGEAEYGFRHALVRDAAYGMLVDTDRALGHRLAAGWLESVGERDARVLAEHLDRAGELARAVPWYRIAAGEAFQGSDLDGCLRSAQRAVACGAEGQILGELLYLQAETCFWRGEMADAARLVRACLEHLTAGSAYWCQAVGGVLVTSAQLGRLDEEETLARAAIATEPAPPARITYLRGAQSNVLVHAALGRHDLAALFLERVEQVAAILGPDPVAAAHLALSRASAARLFHADAWGALVAARAARGSFAVAGGSPSALFSQLEEMLSRAALGDPSLEPDLREAAAAAERHQAAVFLPQLTALHALVLARGARAETASAIARAERFTADVGDKLSGAHGLTLLAEAHLAAGDTLGATRAASRALTLVVGAPRRAASLAVLSLAGARSGHVEEALAAAREAEGLARPLPSIGFEESLVHLAVVEATRAAGDHEAARTAAAHARRRLVERAARIADPSLRATFLAAVPEHARILALAGELA